MKIKDYMYEKVQLGIEGKICIELKDPITNKVVERVEKHNTISEWVAKIHEGYIRSQVYQGSMGGTMVNWFKSIVLSSTPLNIHINTKNINIYKLDATGTYLKDYDNHSLITGYCKDLTTSLAASSKAGVYDIVASNLGRKINSTRRVFDFPANKAIGTISSVFFAGTTDPFFEVGTLYDYVNISLPSNINNLTSQTAYKIIGKLNNNNYVVTILSGTITSLYELNPSTGEIVSTTTLSSGVSASNIAIVNNIIYCKTSENSAGSITIKKATWGVGTLDAGTIITIQKPSDNWFAGKCLISDGSYLYSIHSTTDHKFFFAKINVDLTTIIYFDYLTNTIDLQFSSWVIDPSDNTLEIGCDTMPIGSQMIKYKVTPSNTNEYLNLYTNAEQFRYTTDAISGGTASTFYSGVFKYNNKYYAPHGQIEVFGNNFGSMVNLDTPIIKDASHSMTVTYDYTIL